MKSLSFLLSLSFILVLSFLFGERSSVPIEQVYERRGRRCCHWSRGRDGRENLSFSFRAYSVERNEQSCTSSVTQQRLLKRTEKGSEREKIGKGERRERVKNKRECNSSILSSLLQYLYYEYGVFFFGKQQHRQDRKEIGLTFFIILRSFEVYLFFFSSNIPLLLLFITNSSGSCINDRDDDIRRRKRSPTRKQQKRVSSLSTPVTVLHHEETLFFNEQSFVGGSLFFLGKNFTLLI